MLVAAGDRPNSARREVWETIKRSFDKPDGARRKADLRRIGELVETLEGVRFKIFPGECPRVLRIVRKAIRGLSHHHGVGFAVSDRNVTATLMPVALPLEVRGAVHTHHRELDIVNYRFYLRPPGLDSPVLSWWHLTFFEMVEFLGCIRA